MKETTLRMQEVTKVGGGLMPENKEFEVLVCLGQVCPACGSGDVEVVGCAPDGMHMNEQYMCRVCGEGWEGY